MAGDNVWMRWGYVKSPDGDNVRMHEVMGTDEWDDDAAIAAAAATSAKTDETFL